MYFNWMVARHSFNTSLQQFCKPILYFTVRAEGFWISELRAKTPFTIWIQKQKRTKEVKNSISTFGLASQANHLSLVAGWENGQRNNFSWEYHDVKIYGLSLSSSAFSRLPTFFILQRVQWRDSTTVLSWPAQTALNENYYYHNQQQQQ